MQHWNKNEGSEVHQRFYKGTHALSYSELSHKIGALIGTLVRMKRNTSTDELRSSPAVTAFSPTVASPRDAPSPQDVEPLDRETPYRVLSTRI